MKNNPNFKIGRFSQVDNNNVKLSIDKPNDLKNVTKIFKFYKPNIFFSVKSIFKKNLHKKLVKSESNILKKLQSKTSKGQNLWKKANNYISGGSMLLSKNPERYLPNFWPTYFKSAKGCIITDLNQNKFIDFSLMGVGTNVLGYANSKIDNEVKKNITKSNMSTLNCAEEVLLAEKLIELHPWANKVRFARTGESGTASSRV